jgi:aryl-alcohol dehydrogenase-like predicted oxidoreductase
MKELLLVLKSIGEKYNVSISNVAIRYIVDKPAVGSVIVGARLSIAEHIADNLGVFSFPGLDATDLSLIHTVVQKGRPLPGDCGDEYR